MAGGKGVAKLVVGPGAIVRTSGEPGSVGQP